MRPKRNQIFEYEQFESYQFDFNIHEANETDNEIEIDVETTSLHDDLQQQNLTPDQLQHLFSQVSSELIAESVDDQKFFKREVTIKPPKASKVIQTPFPPPLSDRKEDFDISIEELKQLVKKEAGPLIIERHSPNTEEIDHVLSTVSLTFSQPMIAIVSLHEQMNPEDLGISLTPKIEGRWRWIDTKTIQFEANHRVPYATKYTLRVNKELCVSAVGGIEHREYNDRRIIIHNNSQPNTVYRLFIQPGLLKDIHGQVLEQDDSDQPIQFHVDDLNSPLFGALSGESDKDGTVTAWVTNLMTGAPISQATVSILNQKKITNKQGLCTIERCMEENNERRQVESREKEILVVEKDDDLCMEVNIYPNETDDDVYVWHVFNDRGLYRPKEDLYIKGYVRLLKQEGEAKVPTYSQGVIDYMVYDSQDQQLQQSKVELNKYGAFDVTFTLTENVNLGDGYVEFSLPDSKNGTKHYFNVQEFRKPEYQVSSMIRPTIAHFRYPTVDEYVIVTCQGKLFSGGYLSYANVKWTVQAETTTFIPAKRFDYIFGRGQSFFSWFDDDDETKISYPTKHLQGKTNNKGQHEIKITYHGIEQEPRPIIVRALAAITDLNSQIQETQANFLIHPCTYYVGFQFVKNYGKKDELVRTKVIVTDIDGNLINNVLVQCDIIGHGKEKKEDQNGLTIFEDVTDEQRLTIFSSNEDAVNIDYTPKIGKR
ncbi:unnamed protein product [Rotaria sp. Silwood2]|nr:unnamed protein product [Rotaria sp. Silwood2]